VTFTCSDISQEFCEVGLLHSKNISQTIAIKVTRPV